MSFIVTRYFPAGTLEMSIVNSWPLNILDISFLKYIYPCSLISTSSLGCFLKSTSTLMYSLAGLGLILKFNSDELVSVKPTGVQGTAR